MNTGNDTVKDIVSKILDKMQVLDQVSVRIDGIERQVKTISADIHDMDKKFDAATERLISLEKDFYYLKQFQEELKNKHEFDVDVLHRKFRDFEPKVEKVIEDKISTNTTILGQKNKIWLMGGALSFLSAMIGAVVSAIFR